MRSQRAGGLLLFNASEALRREVTADDVVPAFHNLALAERTAGLAVTVDGGNVAAAPR